MEKRHFRFEVTGDDAGKRIDKFLGEKFVEDLSRSYIQRLICEGSVILNGAPVKNSRRIESSDIIEVSIPPRDDTDLEAEDIPLDIIYEDDHIIVVNKPANMVVHPAPGNYSGTLVNALLGHHKRLSSTGERTKPGIVHRLDKGTSGLLVIAKTDEAHRKISKQFVKKTLIKRVYVAVVRGVMELDNGIIELPIGRSRYDRKKMAVNPEDGKSAVTRYRVIERFKGSTLVELELGTGRTHQIRVHMSHIGHPILGDSQYGSDSEISRPALHARTLGFVHPATKQYIEFKSDLPADMKRLIKKERM
jgi:23S rRNA pseudouridine1911/1915/1917 synthase